MIIKGKDALKEFDVVHSHGGHAFIFNFLNKKNTNEVFDWLNANDQYSFTMSRRFSCENYDGNVQIFNEPYQHLNDLVVSFFELDEEQRNEKLKKSVERVLLDHLVSLHQPNAVENFLRSSIGLEKASDEFIRSEYQNNKNVRNFISKLRCYLLHDVVESELEIPDTCLKNSDEIYHVPADAMTGVVPYTVIDRNLFKIGEGKYDIRYKAIHSLYSEDSDPVTVVFKINANGKIIPDMEKSNFSEKIGHGDFFVSIEDALRSTLSKGHAPQTRTRTPT